MPRRAAASLAAIAVLSVLLAAIASAAPPKVYVPTNVVDSQLAYRPHEIVLAADGTFAMSHIHWLSYGGAGARATARAYTRGCTPDCAQGKVTEPAAKLRLGHRVSCRGQLVYTRLHYVLQGKVPAGRRHRGSILLLPLGEAGC